MSLAAPIRRPVLADLISRPWTRIHAFAVGAGLILAGVALVALLAKVAFFISPVPIAGQTLGVIVAGAALGFIPAAFLAGWLAERAWDRKPAFAFAGFVGASVVPFIIGVPYMAPILAAAAALIVPGAWLFARAADRSKEG
jgi:biotin transport system substrate-specific component